MMEKAFVFVNKQGNKYCPVKFQGNKWMLADCWSEATYFASLDEASKKQKYAPFCDIVSVKLEVKIENFNINVK